MLILGTIVKNDSICDQLGQIDIILSDKTGTLTLNSMELKKVCYPTDSRFTLEDALSMQQNSKKNNMIYQK